MKGFEIGSIFNPKTESTVEELTYYYGQNYKDKKAFTIKLYLGTKNY